MNETLGLREQIAGAKTVKTVETLLAQGYTYKQVSAKTKRAWTATAKRKVKELAVAKEVKAAVVLKATKKV